MNKQNQSFWERNGRDIKLILLAEVGVIIMGFTWVFLFLK